MERVRPEPALKAPQRRKSVFMEVGLVDEETVRRERSPAPTLIQDPSPNRLRPSRTVRFRSQNDVFDEREELASDQWESVDEDEDEYDSIATSTVQPTPNPFTHSKMYRLGLLTVILALMLPVLQMNPISSMGVRGGVIPRDSIEYTESKRLVKRQDTSTEVCKRWAGQTAVVNGTLYMYGFRTTTDAKQTKDTWTNDFLTLDLTKSWQISSPSLTAQPKPSGPPEISLGYLWGARDALWLYGGQYADINDSDTTIYPGPNSVWEYNIGNKEWVEHKDPKSSAGVNAEGGGQSIQRAAEGAGFSVSTLGRGWYFGGHLDDHTTEGWSNQVARIYLKSLLEFTFPGYSNNAVDDLKDGNTAGQDGAFRNVTEGGLQETSSFPERADGILVYVPGFGDEGILLGLTGGDNDTFTQMNIIDVYDIAKSTWYKQTTSGTMPKYRVNPCAVVAAAADGSSYNIYMFGGQNLVPAGEQVQYDDMWILSVPSFTWIEVDQSSQSVPYARAGHSCHAWDSQMIVIGGYVGQELSCDSPGIYVFNMSSLKWSDQFTALTGERALQAFNGQENSGNPLAQQANQRGFDSKAGLEGSYGYSVPDKVQSVIGGQATGGATLTAPQQTPTEGPFKTGKPMTYTVTGPNGAIITETVSGGSGGGNNKGTRIGAIVAGVVAGVLAVVAAYFAFCAWVYRKQVKIWKNHAAMVSARSEREKGPDAFGATIASSGKNSSEQAQRNILATTSSAAGSGRYGPPGSADGVRTSGEAAAAAGAAGTGAGYDPLARRSSDGSITDDFLEGQEPTFWGTRGVLLNPRRSLRVINRD